MKKKDVDKERALRALITISSKAFDCLDHGLLTTKLNACGFVLPALKIIHNYMSNWWQKTNVNLPDSEWFRCYTIKKLKKS